MNDNTGPMEASFLEHVTTPLNACSLETIQTSISLENLTTIDNTDNDNNNDDTRKVLVWPMMLGCYELDESKGRRQGRLDLYTVVVPEEEDTNQSSLQFGSPMNIMGGKDATTTTAKLTTTVQEPSGVLDGKWYKKPGLDNNNNHNDNLYYATAHASGKIIMHQIRPNDNNNNNENNNDSDDDENNKYNNNSLLPFQVTKIAESEVEDEENNNNALCLALAWDASLLGNNSTRIISSYSDGHVAIHEIALDTNNNNNSSGNSNDSDNDTHTTTAATTTKKLNKVASWQAHKIFHSPAEVWCASFTNSSSNDNPNIVLTGGDDGTVKLWDLRTVQSSSLSSSPIHTLKHFEAGATVLSPHPRREHLIACGSYDETMALLDLRKITTIENSKPKVLCHTDPLGGGLWRMKWHPYDDDRILLGAMHGGCRVVTFDGMDIITQEEVESATASSSSSFFKPRVTHKFTKHQSMAYGADWLVCRRQSGSNLRIEAAASCSFYDRAMYLWKVQ